VCLRSCAWWMMNPSTWKRVSLGTPGASAPRQRETLRYAYSVRLRLSALLLLLPKAARGDRPCALTRTNGDVSPSSKAQKFLGTIEGLTRTPDFVLNYSSSFEDMLFSSFFLHTCASPITSNCHHDVRRLLSTCSERCA
jgi:hypothetical protein